MTTTPCPVGATTVQLSIDRATDQSDLMMPGYDVNQKQIDIDEALEAWRKSQTPPLERPEAIKELVRRELENEGFLHRLPIPASEDRYERARQDFVRDLGGFQSSK